MQNTNSSEYEAKHRYKGNIARDYDDERIAEPRWQREQEAFSKYLTLIPSGSSLLDMPLGTGRFIEFYKDQKLKVHGVDISEDMLNES